MDFLPQFRSASEEFKRLIVGCICLGLLGESRDIESRESAAVRVEDTEGKVWFSLNHATTDSDCIKVFLRYLIKKLD